jgi:iron complex transport system substrate-binding protein
MKKIRITLPILMLVIVLAISACAPAAATPTEDIATEAPTEAATEEPVALTEELDEKPFTVQADPDLEEALTLLYQAYYAGDSPAFVEADPDLLVTAVSDGAYVPGDIPAVFLPDAVLIPQNDSPDVAKFITFAISIDGQHVLIDAGLLPAAITITDQAGNTIEIAQPVQKVISAYGPATAMIYGVDGEVSLVAAAYLGARNAAGAAAMENIDPRFQELSGDNLFSQQDFNIEETARLDPDLIIASARTSWLDTASELGIPYVLYDAETPDRLTEAILMTGSLFGPHATAQAQAWVEYYDWLTQSILDRTETIADADRPQVLFTGTNALRVASGDMYQTSLIEIAGGVSVSAELTGYWNDVNLEQIAAWDPDIIIVPPYGGATVEAITEDPDWQILSAVQEGRVYQMPKMVVPWDTPSPDSVLGIIWMAQTLFPELETPDCAEQANFFYNTFYNYAITPEEIDSICAFD